MLEGGDSSDSDDELLGNEEEPDFAEHKGHPGLYYKVRTWHTRRHTMSMLR